MQHDLLKVMESILFIVVKIPLKKKIPSFIARYISRLNIRSKPGMIAMCLRGLMEYTR